MPLRAAGLRFSVTATVAMHSSQQPRLREKGEDRAAASRSVRELPAVGDVGTVDPDLQELLDELRSCEAGSSAALASLMTRLRRIGRSRLAIRSTLRIGFDTEDLSQEGLVQLIANLDRFRGTTMAEFLSFANSIISQQVIRQARWQGVRRTELQGGPEVSEQPAATDSPSANVMSDEAKQKLRRLVGSLREEFREPLLLRLEGLSNTDIAARLALREDLVRKRLSRALKELHGKW